MAYCVPNRGSLEPEGLALAVTTVRVRADGDRGAEGLVGDGGAGAEVTVEGDRGGEGLVGEGGAGAEVRVEGDRGAEGLVGDGGAGAEVTVEGAAPPLGAAT